MRITLALVVSFALAVPAAPARAESPFARVPAGSLVKITAEAPGPPLTGTLERAGEDSLFVRTAGGAAVVALPNRSVQSLTFMSGRKPSPRKDVLAGIGLGMAGGAAIGAAIGNLGEGGEGGGEDGGERHDTGADRVTAVAAAAPATPQPTSTAAYRAVVGAVLGGIAGGLFGGAVGFGLTERGWSTIPGPVARAMGLREPEPQARFAVRVALPFGGPRN